MYPPWTYTVWNGESWVADHDRWPVVATAEWDLP